MLQKRKDLRYVIMLPFLASLLFIWTPTIAQALTGFTVPVFRFLIIGFAFKVLAMAAGFWDLRSISASGIEKVRWMLFFFTLGVVAFPVYLYKRFYAKPLWPRSFQPQFKNNRD